MQVKSNIPETVNLKMAVVCFMVKEGADLYQKGDDDKTPISLIPNQESLGIVKSFCNEYVPILFVHTLIPAYFCIC